MITTLTIEACSDCYTYASGDLSSFDYYYDKEESERLIGHIEERTTELCNEHGYMTQGDSLGFSNSSCECCNSHLAGDRHELVFISESQ
jgi:hypothetical protein